MRVVPYIVQLLPLHFERTTSGDTPSPSSRRPGLPRVTGSGTANLLRQSFPLKPQKGLQFDACATRKEKVLYLTSRDKKKEAGTVVGRAG